PTAPELILGAGARGDGPRRRRGVAGKINSPARCFDVPLRWLRGSLGSLGGAVVASEGSPTTPNHRLESCHWGSGSSDGPMEKSGRHAEETKLHGPKAQRHREKAGRHGRQRERRSGEGQRRSGKAKRHGGGSRRHAPRLPTDSSRRIDDTLQKASDTLERPND